MGWSLVSSTDGVATMSKEWDKLIPVPDFKKRAAVPEPVPELQPKPRRMKRERPAPVVPAPAPAARAAPLAVDRESAVRELTRLVNDFLSTRGKKTAVREPETVE